MGKSIYKGYSDLVTVNTILQAFHYFVFVRVYGFLILLECPLNDKISCFDDRRPVSVVRSTLLLIVSRWRQLLLLSFCSSAYLQACSFFQVRKFVIPNNSIIYDRYSGKTLLKSTIQP